MTSDAQLRALAERDRVIGIHPGRSSATMDVMFDGLPGPAGLPVPAELLSRREQP